MKLKTRRTRRGARIRSVKNRKPDLICRNVVFVCRRLKVSRSNRLGAAVDIMCCQAVVERIARCYFCRRYGTDCSRRGSAQNGLQVRMSIGTQCSRQQRQRYSYSTAGTLCYFVAALQDLPPFFLVVHTSPSHQSSHYFTPCLPPGFPQSFPRLLCSTVSHSPVRQELKQGGG